MNLSQQIKPYPRTMYHRDYDKPKVVISKAEEAEAGTKGWTASYIFKEYPKYVGDKIVNSRGEEDRLLAERKPLPEVAGVIEQGPASAEETPPPDILFGEGGLSTTSDSQDPEVVKETQVEGQDTAKVVEKPKKSPGRPKKT